MNIYLEKKYKERYLENNGFIDSYLCINAQTEIEHTEHDSSYTIIVVPQRKLKFPNKFINNSAHFELVINQNKTVVIDMQVGTVLTYSGYMLTHRQQLQKNDNECEPYVNIVSYNSKQLFGNIMESFRHDIHANKKTIASNNKLNLK